MYIYIYIYIGNICIHIYIYIYIYMYIIYVKIYRKVRITTLVQNYKVRSLYNFHACKTCKASRYFQF